MLEPNRYYLDPQELEAAPAFLRAYELPQRKADLLSDLALSLPHDNMGGVNDTGSGNKSLCTKDLGASKSRASPGGEPAAPGEGYFHCLGLDTVQFAVHAKVVNEQAASLLYKGRKAAEKSKSEGKGKLRLSLHDGTAVQVYPNGARPCYSVLWRDAIGLEIRSCPSERVGSMPEFLVRFGAEWCLRKNYADLVKWVGDLVSDCGYQVEEIKLSRLEVRCDVPESFVRRDERRMRGTGTRNADIAMRICSGNLSGLNNQGGTKPFKFNIYDKRLQVSQEGKEIWRRVWSHYGVRAETPVWRVEGKWSREGLLARGIDRAEDLTYRALSGLWSWFTRSYLIMVSDPSKRTDRTKPTRRWRRVQEVTEVVEPLPPVQKAEETPDQLVKQAEGCIATALARSGAARDFDSTMKVIRSLSNGAIDRLRRQRLIAPHTYTPVGTGPSSITT